MDDLLFSLPAFHGPWTALTFMVSMWRRRPQTFFLACGESPVFASRAIESLTARGASVVPPRRADDENGVRRWIGDGGGVLRSCYFDAEPIELHLE